MLAAIGHECKNWGPIRSDDKWNNKYYVSLLEYPYRKLPTFANGAGYAISMATIQKLGKHIPFTDVIRHLDDVYVGMLMHDAGLTWTDDSYFDIGVDNHPDIYIPCNLYNLHQFCINQTFVDMMDDSCKSQQLFHVPSEYHMTSCLK